MNNELLALDPIFMFRTGYPEIYEEFCQKRKLFKLEIHLFASALALGILNNVKSQKKPSHDIIRLSQLSSNGHKEVREVINILSQLAYTGSDKHARGETIIAFSDGGLELLWKDIQMQGILDLPRILDENKKKWSSRIPELLAFFDKEL